MAKCPVCKNTILQSGLLDCSLPILECASCGGVWIRANEYALWLKSQKPGSFELSKVREASGRFPVAESNQAKVCPDCGHFVRKYKIGAGVEFHLERCNSCNGIWLERNEWQVLKTVDLHDELNQIFTQPWQQHIQDEMVARQCEWMYIKEFGEEDYQKIKEIRNWLQEHPRRNRLIAFLVDKDPYSY